MKRDLGKLFKRCLSLVPVGEQKRIVLLIVGQLFLTILDLIGVALFGVLAIISISGIKSSEPGSRTSYVLEHLHLTTFSLETQVSILAFGALLLLTLKTVLTFFVSRRILTYLSIRSAMASSELLRKILSTRILMDQEKTRQEILYSITGGVNLIIVGVIGSLATLLADVFSLGILAIGLFLYSPSVTIISTAYFVLISWINYRILHLKVEHHSRNSTNLSIQNNETTLELIGTFRETYLSGREDYYLTKFSRERKGISQASASLAIYPNVSKYIVEVAMLLGVLALAGFQFLSTDAVRAIGSISIFLAASTRIAPALLRLQQGIFNIKGNLAASIQSLELVEKLEEVGLNSPPIEDPLTSTSDVEISFHNVNFSHKNKNDFKISNLTFEVQTGERIAIVGPSGSGKSTIIDLLLSLKLPSSGNIHLRGVEPRAFIDRNPGKIGFVPQVTTIVNDNLARNIALGVPDAEIDYVRIERLVEELDLVDLYSHENKDLRLGDSGGKISGGQRQRIGIARAIYSEPVLLVLDEATSSLDASSEHNVVEFLSRLSQNMTTITIAHRLSTVLNADRVLYIDSGNLVAQGSFDEVRQRVPDFDRQANLMGL